jgi:hypothetical protein
LTPTQGHLCHNLLISGYKNDVYYLNLQIPLNSKYSSGLIFDLRNLKQYQLNENETIPEKSD